MILPIWKYSWLKIIQLINCYFLSYLRGKAKVKVAENVKVAIEILESKKFHIIIIIMDINMAIMNGYEAMKIIIRSKAEFKDYKIIVITGSGNKKNVSRLIVI
jgi:CheY-like chemotaxis protein